MSGIKGINKGRSNGNWKEKIGYQGLHQWIRRNLFHPIHCQECKLNKVLEVANISGKYKRDLSDWEWICRGCHMKKDGRLNILHQRDYILNENQLQALNEGRKKRWLNPQ